MSKSLIGPEEIKKGSIFIIDDNEMNIEVLKKILKQDGFVNVSSCSNPMEALELYKKHEYDLIILDLNMPGMNGFEVMRELKKTYPNSWLPILVLTAQNDQATKIRCLSLGAKDFIAKPIDRLEASTRIKNILEAGLLQKALVQQNKELESRVSERTKGLLTAYEDLTACLKRASQHRDNETGNHIIRMASFSQILAKELGMDEEFQKHILNAAAMHDIGKIGISDNILNRPGKLSAQEFEIMKQHSQIGFDILSVATNNSPMLSMAAKIALCHHERFDGSGYPQGLAGEAIPMEARIVALADVFDALLSERPYKRPWSREEAIAHIRENSGKHFDPKVVAAFEKRMNDFFALLDIYKESASIMVPEQLR